MHDGTIIRVTGQQVRHNFAKGFGEQTFVQILDGLVYIFFTGGNSALLVTFVAHGKR
jgi:hypothetical protein